MKKINIIITLILLTVILAGCGSKTETVSTAQAEEITVCARVNGEDITTEERDYFSTRLKSDIVNEYAAKYNIEDFSDFWNNTYDGVSPEDDLNNRALTAAVRAKIELVLMRENGIFDDISFAGLRSKAEEYNKAHKNMSGNVGINTIDTDSFYTYYIETGEAQLKNILDIDDLDSYIDSLTEKADITIL